MSLPEICIRRPVFATVLSLLLVLVGIVSYDRLPVREYPNIDQPVVSVVTTYPGASPEIMESQVTQVLEASIAGIPGIDVLSSTSRSESSRITARFTLDTDSEDAAADVRDRVSRVRGRLPEEVDEPVINKVEADADPILYLAFTSDRISSLDITDFVDRDARDRLQNLDGVAEVQILGERRYAMRIWVDRDRLAAYGLTVQDIEDAIRRQNLEVPSGRIESTDREFSVLTRTGLTTPEQFAAIAVKDADGFAVTLGDVARVEIGPEDDRRVTRFNGKNSVTIGIIKQATANPLDVARAVRAALPELLENLPAGMDAVIANDTTVFIERSIAAVFTTIAEAVGLVVLVTLLFLRSFRATIIPVVTIPVSLIATFALMYAFGFSINTLTLLALVLAIGLVVDDAIVVLENVYRHIEAGERPFDAAMIGTREIVFAIIAMTLTLAAVYAPIALTPGRTGRLFIEFALALAGAVLVSGFVALTLTPMMCSRLLKPHAEEGRVARFLGRGLDGLERGYRRLLTLVIARSWLLVPLVALVLGCRGRPVRADPQRAVAVRGPRLRAGLGARPGRGDDRLDHAQHAAAGADPRRRARGREHLPDRRRAGSDARHRRDPAQALGGTDPLAGGDRADLAAAAGQGPGRGRGGQQPAVPGPGRAQPARAARAPDQRQLRGSGRGHRPVRACGRGLAGHHRRQRRAQPGDAAARRDLRPAEDRRSRPERRQRRAHARELPGRPAR